MTVLNWVQKADLEPRGGRDLEKIPLGETVVKVNGEPFWLVAAVESDTNVIPHVRLHPSRNSALIKMFLWEVKEKHAIDKKFGIVDGAPWLHSGTSNCVCTFGTKPSASATWLTVSFKKYNEELANSTIPFLVPVQNQLKSG